MRTWVSLSGPVAAFVTRNFEDEDEAELLDELDEERFLDFLLVLAFFYFSLISSNAFSYPFYLA